MNEGEILFRRGFSKTSMDPTKGVAMPTKIKVILPAQPEDDVASTISEDAEYTARQSVPDTEVRATQTDFVLDLKKQIQGSPSRKKYAPPRRMGFPRASSAPVSRRPLHMTRVTAFGGNESSKRFVKQHQHEMDSGQDLGNPMMLARYNRRPGSAAVGRSRTAENTTRVNGYGPIRSTPLAFSSTYDIDLEYQDIMVKALHAYSRHRHTEVTADSIKRTHTKTSSENVGYSEDDQSPNAMPINISPEKENVYMDPQRSTPEPSLDDVDITHVGEHNEDVDSKVFKLSHCRLRYNETDEEPGEKTTMKRRRPMSARVPPSSSSRCQVVLHPPPVSDGILADSIGRVYKTHFMKPSQQKQRPWTALPCRFSDYLKLSDKDNGANENKRSRSPQPSFPDQPVANGHDLQTSDVQIPHPIRSTDTATAHRLHVHTIRLGQGKMSGGQGSSRSVAYQRRNKTTHSWYDTGAMMSQSLPSSSFLHRQFIGGGSSIGSSPRSSRDATAESPVGKSNSLPRPSASYSYDGGFFVGAHAPPAEYFVIHPDWVSEAMTIKKLSINNKTPPRVIPKPTRKTWQGRRCMSAPPAKIRNPITWDQNMSGPINVPVRRK